MGIKNFLLKNFGIRVVALFLAIFVWAIIAGRERSFLIKTFDINVEYFNNGSNIDVRSVTPDKVRVKVQGMSNVMNRITADDFKLRIDLKRLNEGTRLNYLTEDYLQYPPKINILSIQPRMIEITSVEFDTRELKINVHYRGTPKPGVHILEKRLVPEKIRVMGYKYQIANRHEVDTIGWIDLNQIEGSQVIKLKLKKEKDFLKFEGADTVDVYIVTDQPNPESKSSTSSKDKQ